MSKSLWTGGGSSVVLSNQLGKGGEGSVFELSPATKQVAKLYHQLPEVDKQEKLKFMVANAAQDLLIYSAWPTETLHATRGGPVVGFLMERVSAKQPVHMIYSPAHRKQDYPKVAWDFLLYVARNTAAAFEVIHRHGHVLGDVNQGNVMAGLDSKVVLIDSDSMQITSGGKTHLCEVGVSHFTPPELQGISSFSTVARTSNHDAFGLALLIFHLLFGGRHPFAGRPLRDDVGNALETDIKLFRFAYGSDAASRGFATPPRSIPITLVPPSTQAMFHRAFTEAGAQKNGRPRASEWVAELDRIRNTLKTCGRSKMHVYPNHATQCPWCELEQAGAHFFIDLGVVVATAGSSFVLSRVWAAIEGIRPPKPPVIPSIASVTVIAKPLPKELKKKKSHVGSFIALALIAAVSLYFAPGFGWLIAMLCGGIWLTISGGSSEAYNKEIAARIARRNDLQGSYDRLQSEMQRAVSPNKFDQEKRGLAIVRQSYLDLPAMEKSMLASVTTAARERQMTAYLEKFFIEDANISGLGPNKRASLRSFGIETAADISYTAVSAVKGFGPKLTSQMVTWRNQCEAGFRFNASPSALIADTARVNQEISAQRQKLESSLQSGLERLTKLRIETDAAVLRLSKALQTANSELAQATADALL
ncbi:MAG: helix-hairpin-helix domain-containing protein [Xylophilus ampelinus]